MDRAICHLGSSEGGGILVAQAGVLLDVLDEADQGRLVDPPVLEVVLLLPKHPLSCTVAHWFCAKHKKELLDRTTVEGKKTIVLEEKQEGE